MSVEKKVDWQAHWIWHKDDPESPNIYMYFRREFSLDTDISNALCYVSADTCYKLYINGKFVGNGPVLTEPRWQSYDRYHVGQYLKVGKNVVAAIVYHFGNAIDNPTGYTMGWSRGGFLCQLDIEHKTKRKESIITDQSWDVLISSAWSKTSPMMDRMTFCEMYDARKEPDGWMSENFSGRHWTPAEIITIDKSMTQWIGNPSSARVLPWACLEPRSIPYFIREQIIPKAIINSGEVLELAESNNNDVAVRMSIEKITPFCHTSIGNIESLIGENSNPAIVNPMSHDISYEDFKGVYDPTVTLDIGKLINGRVFLNIDVDEGVVVDIAYGQILVEDRIIPYLSNRTVMADQYITQNGHQIIETFNWRHFRYIQLTFRHMNSVVKINNVKAISESYPFAKRGDFECSDETLNWIWQACIKTTKLCTYDRVMDNPSRERREYTGDVLNVLHGFYAAFGDLDIIRKYFKDIKRGQLPTGMFSTSILGQKREHFRSYLTGGLDVNRIWEYYELFGNNDILEEMFEPVLAFIRHLEDLIDDKGLIGESPYPLFIDWSDIDMRGHNLCINAVFAQAMSSLSKMANVLGRTDIALRYEEKAKRLFDILRKKFWDEEKGVFIDALIDGKKSDNVSEHANFLMILFGGLDSKQAESIIERIYGENHFNAAQLSPLYYWASEALFAAKQGHIAVSMMKQRYGRIRKQGLDTIAELWNLFGEKYTGRWRSRDSRSAVQTGGISAAYLLSRYVLGVAPLKEGFNEVLIAPQLSGLKWAKGIWPSPKGDIHVNWKNDNGQFVIEVTLPSGMKGNLIIPPEARPSKRTTLNDEEISVESKTIELLNHTKIELNY